MSAPASFRTLIPRTVPSSSITFHKGMVLERGVTITNAISLEEGRIAVFLNKTPFHPVNKKWPDQPSDRGVLSIGEKRYEVESCEIFGIHREDFKVLDISSVDRNDLQNWSQSVGHLISFRESEVSSLLNKVVDAQVDTRYRSLLSLHHTASHLAAIALNKVASEFWDLAKSRGIQKDSLGNPDLDNKAIVRSTIGEQKSREEYRFGKKIQKAGFNAVGFLEQAQRVEKRINDLIAFWLQAKDSPIEIDASNDSISGRRTWKCKLLEGSVEIPCGGTHISSTGLAKSITVSLSPDLNQKELVVSVVGLYHSDSQEEKKME